jgi:hypothetical protein
LELGKLIFKFNKMDLKCYIERKEKGLIQLISAGGGFAFASSKFDQLTGEPTTPEIQAVSLDELLELKKTIKEDLINLEAVILDMQSLKK